MSSGWTPTSTNVKICARIGVRHFTRRGRARHNTEAGAFKARTKHGNYNAWLEAHGDAYAASCKMPAM